MVSFRKQVALPGHIGEAAFKGNILPAHLVELRQEFNLPFEQALDTLLQARRRLAFVGSLYGVSHGYLIGSVQAAQWVTC